MPPTSIAPFLLVLGVAQDGGHPQPGCTRSCCAGLDATGPVPSQIGHLQASIAIVDPSSSEGPGRRWLIDASPALPTQLDRLDAVAPRTSGASGAPSALTVPHRDEYSETVAWKVTGPSRSALYLPDIDRWDTWNLKLEDVLRDVDVAYLDGTFWADGELSRDMSEVPHPRISDTVARLSSLPASERTKVRFIHMNHTNPALNATSPESLRIAAAGFHVAVEGERVEL